MREPVVARVRRGVRLYYLVVAAVPLALSVGLAWMALGASRTPNAGDAVALGGMLVLLLGLASVLVWRSTDFARIERERLTARALTQRTVDLRHEVVYWGWTQRTPGLLGFKTLEGVIRVPVGTLDNREGLITRIVEVCGPPTPLRKTRDYVFEPE